MSLKYRIYYESYEQAAHHLLPALMKAVPNVNFELVRLSKITMASKSTVAKSIVKSLLFKNPDALFTIIYEDVEYPLAWLEISTAVETEDHDLQRFDSIVATSLSNIPFVKVWARRKSPGPHGGNTTYDKTISLRVARQILKIPAFEIDWPTTAGQLQAVRHPNYNACPRDIDELASIIKIAIDGVKKSRDACEVFLNQAATIKDTWIQSQIAQSLGLISPYAAKNSTRLYKIGSSWTLKFNRWGHAMDPERGMVWFYKHRLNQRLLGILHDKVAKSAASGLKNFMDATGIKLGSYKNLGPHNIDKDIMSSQVNTAGRAIVANCKSFTVCDVAGNPLISFQWTITLQQLMTSELKKCTVALTTGLKPFNKTEEDDVTYAVSCDLYPKNGFSIESVSYPGAQGDKALLAVTGGRSVERTYIDIVASKIMSNKTVLSLTESKGVASHNVLSGDAEKVLSWKMDATKRNTLISTYSLKGSTVDVLCSVAYPGSALTPFGSLNKLDFVVTVDNAQWVMWIPAGKVPNGFSKLKGAVKIYPRWHY